MDERSRSAVARLGTTLAAVGGGALVALAVSEKAFSRWAWSLAWTAFGVGLLILVLQIPALDVLAFWPWRRIRKARIVRRALDARYRQGLRCDACGHEFEETVMNTTRGWLMVEGAERKCPACGSGNGFQSLGSVPLNRAARKLGAL
jgi:hypothetical protein